MGCWPQGLLEAACGTVRWLYWWGERIHSHGPGLHHLAVMRSAKAEASWAQQGRSGWGRRHICRPGRVRLTDEMSSFLRPAADGEQWAYLYGPKHWMYLVRAKNMSVSSCLQDYGLPFLFCFYFHINSMIVTRRLEYYGLQLVSGDLL